MSVSINYSGRFGNNITQYIFARIFSENNGLQLITNFNHTNSPIGFTDHTTGSIISGNQLIINDYSENILDAAWTPSNYLISGYFQKSKYYINRRNQILSFIKGDNISVNYDDIVMHVRLGDYLFKIHPEWYLNILKKQKFNNLYIVMEEEDQKYLSYFSQYNPICISTNQYDDWNFIRTFDRILCSNSTFGWWAAFLSNASKIWIFNRWTTTPDLYHLNEIPNGIQIDGPLIKSYLSNDSLDLDY
jgi:hypothetical protein